MRLGDKAGSARGKEGGTPARRKVFPSPLSLFSLLAIIIRCTDYNAHKQTNPAESVQARVEHLRRVYSERESAVILRGFERIFASQSAEREIERALGKWKTEARANIGTRRGFQIAAPKKRRRKKRAAGACSAAAINGERNSIS